MSIERTTERRASLRGSDLFVLVRALFVRRRTRVFRRPGTGNSYGVRTVECAALYIQATPTEFGT